MPRSVTRRRPVRGAILLAPALALPLGRAQAQIESSRWTVTVRAEQTRLGSYVDHSFEEPTVSNTGEQVGSSRRTTELRTAPMIGAGAEVTFAARRSPWGAVATVGYGHGHFNSHEAVFLDRFDGGTATVPIAEWSLTGPASAWRMGAGLVRRVGAPGGRTAGSVMAGPLLTVVRLRLPTLGDPLPPSFGLSLFRAGPDRTRTYLSPGLTAGAGATTIVGRRLAVELRVSGGVLRADGDAVARDLAEAAVIFNGRPQQPAPIGAPWRGFAVLGAGVSYAIGGR